jgi:putative transposase
LLWVVVQPANVQDRAGAKRVLCKARARLPTLGLIWAEGGYAGQRSAWTREVCTWVLEIVKRSDTTWRWGWLPPRGGVERTFGWLSACRGLARDYDFHAETSAGLIQVAPIHLMVRRLAKGGRPQVCPG